MASNLSRVHRSVRGGETVFLSALVLLAASTVFAAGGSPASQPAAVQAGPDPGQLAERLNSPEFSIRQLATCDLLDAGPAAVPVMRRLLRDRPAPEVQMRVRLAAELLFNRLAISADQRQGFIGIQMKPAEQGDGVEITAVLPFLPAERAELKAGDIILEVNRQKLPQDTGTMILQNQITQTPPGEKIVFKIKRADKEFTLSLAPTAKPLGYSSSDGASNVQEQFKAWYLREIDPTADAASLEPASLTGTNPGPVLIRNNGQGQVIIQNVVGDGPNQQVQMRIQVQGGGGGVVIQNAKIQVNQGGVVIQPGANIQIQNVPNVGPQKPNLPASRPASQPDPDPQP